MDLAVQEFGLHGAPINRADDRGVTRVKGVTVSIDRAGPEHHVSAIISRGTWPLSEISRIERETAGNLTFGLWLDRKGDEDGEFVEWERVDGGVEQTVEFASDAPAAYSDGEIIGGPTTNYSDDSGFVEPRRGGRKID